MDGIQGTLGGLVSSLGPVGLAAGAAGAIGIGLINGALQNADTQSQAFKQSVADLTSELITAGKDGSVSLDYIVQKLQALATETDAAQPSLVKLNKAAHESKSSYKDLAETYAGSTAKLKDMVATGGTPSPAPGRSCTHRHEHDRRRPALSPTRSADIRAEGLQQVPRRSKEQSRCGRDC